MHTLSLPVLTLLHGVISSPLLYVVHTRYSIRCSHFCFFIFITIDCIKSDINFLLPVPLLFYLTLVLVSIHLGNVKPYKSEFSFHSAILGFGNCMAALWSEGHIFSTQLVAQVFTFLLALPHLFALMTAVYYILNRIHLTRTMIHLSLLTIFCCIHKRDAIEPLPDRLETSNAYRTIQDVWILWNVLHTDTPTWFWFCTAFQHNYFAYML